MHYHSIPCNTMQYHAIPCNSMQYHAITCIFASLLLQWHCFCARCHRLTTIGTLQPVTFWMLKYMTIYSNCMFLLVNLSHMFVFELESRLQKSPRYKHKHNCFKTSQGFSIVLCTVHPFSIFILGHSVYWVLTQCHSVPPSSAQWLFILTKSVLLGGASIIQYYEKIIGQLFFEVSMNGLNKFSFSTFNKLIQRTQPIQLFSYSAIQLFW